MAKKPVEKHSSNIRHQQGQTSWVVTSPVSALEGSQDKKICHEIQPSAYFQINLKFPLQYHFGTVLLLSLSLSLSHWHFVNPAPLTTSLVAHGNKMSLPEVCPMVLDFSVDKYTAGCYCNVYSTKICAKKVIFKRTFTSPCEKWE